jgi:dissimilatory sulfite reductase (desulfoviridin) alpha/beta subunit
MVGKTSKEMNKRYSDFLNHLYETLEVNSYTKIKRIRLANEFKISTHVIIGATNIGLIKRSEEKKNMYKSLMSFRPTENDIKKLIKATGDIYREYRDKKNKTINKLKPAIEKQIKSELESKVLKNIEPDGYSDNISYVRSEILINELRKRGYSGTLTHKIEI